MTRHRYDLLRSVVHRLRPFPASFAAAAAVHDPGLLLYLKATQRERAVSLRERGRDQGSERSCSSSSHSAACPDPTR
jgi:hypothetical protein